MVNRHFTAFIVIRPSQLNKTMAILSAGKTLSWDDLFEFRYRNTDAHKVDMCVSNSSLSDIFYRIGIEGGVPEYEMRTIVNANSATRQSRRVTTESRFVILVMAHDGIAMRVYKSSSSSPVEQVIIC
jgi:hypothetical protein